MRAEKVIQAIDKAVQSTVKRGWRIAFDCTIDPITKTCCPIGAVALSKRSPEEVFRDPKLTYFVADVLGTSPAWVLGFVDAVDNAPPVQRSNDDSYFTGYAAGREYRSRWRHRRRSK